MGRFNLDVVADEEARTPWEFTLAGRVWRLPHVADLTLEQQMWVDSGRMDLAVEQVAQVQGDDGAWVETWTSGEGDSARAFVAAKECATAVRRLRGKRRGLLQVAWLAHAGMEPGESGASSS